MKLTIDKRETEGVVILTCRGRIMIGEDANALRDTLKQVCSSARKVVLNLSGVTYIDSGSLGIMLGVYNSARSEGIEIKLAALGQRLQEVLQTTRLTRVFEVYGTEEEALAALGAGAA